MRLIPKMPAKWTRITCAFLWVIATTATACQKEGLDGISTITGTISHHGHAIRGATVFIKFGSNELPGTTESDFDASVDGNGSGNYTIEHLNQGEYYLYAVGYDSLIDTLVRGGLPVTIGKQENKVADIAVSE